MKAKRDTYICLIAHSVWPLQLDIDTSATPCVPPFPSPRMLSLFVSSGNDRTPLLKSLIDAGLRTTKERDLNINVAKKDEKPKGKMKIRGVYIDFDEKIIIIIIIIK